MKIINSLKNRNIKKYLVLSAISVLIIYLILFIVINLVFSNESTNILKKYNINDISESFAINELNKQYMNLYLVILLFLLILFILITIYFLKALNKNEDEVKQMRRYLEEISNKNYSFDINNISESEYSNLKEDIYKIVVNLKEKSDMLENDREVLSNYLADISHQLRTPLMAISASTDAIIENEQNLDASTRKFIYNISNQLNQLNWLVDSLLKMAKLDTKSVQFIKKDVNVYTLIKRIENNMSIFLEQKNIELKLDIYEKIYMYVDERWMMESLENILKNSIEYSRENSVIYINCIKNPLYTLLTIKDHGIGISKKDLPRIFDKFYKGKNSSKNSFGIGLCLSKSIIQNHNGEISVESKLNEGTKFLVKIYNEKS